MKRKMFLGLCMATFIAPVAMAQYAREQRDRGVTLELAALRQAQQQKRRHDHDRHRHRQRREIERRCDCKRAEADVTQPVADHRVALEHERHAQKRRAQRHQHAHHERAHEKRIRQHLQNDLHTFRPPRNRRAASLCL